MLPALRTVVPEHNTISAPRATTGLALTVTVMLAVALHPLGSDPVTVYVVVALGTKGTAFVTLFDHTKLVAPVALKVMLVPAQTAKELLLTVSTGVALTVIVVLIMLVQPWGLVPVTV